jgi:hypothetical protein
MHTDMMTRAEKGRNSCSPTFLEIRIHQQVHLHREKLILKQKPLPLVKPTLAKTINSYKHSQ